jgi:hypothetical protein
MYPKAFDATRDVLRSYRFALERVDAANGVITTQQKFSPGLGALWDQEQSTMSDEFEDFLNQRSRRVRVTFRPRYGWNEDAPAPIDPNEELVGRVEVIIYRMETPGLRPPSKAILMTGLATDPELTAEGLGGAYQVPVSQDTRLAARLAADLAKQIGAGAAMSADEPRETAQRLARP